MLTRCRSYLPRLRTPTVLVRTFRIHPIKTTVTATATTVAAAGLAIKTPTSSKHTRNFSTKMTAIDALPLDKLTYVRGNAQSWDQLKGKKIIVLELWASWCGPCVKSIPHLTELAHQYAPRDVIFIGVTDEDEKTAKQFVAKMGDKMDYIVAADPDGHLEQIRGQFNVNGIPHAFVIDKDGKVAYSGHPMQPQFESKLDVCSNELKESLRPRISLKGKSSSDLMSMSVKDLKAAMVDNNIDPRGCLEKQELVDKILANL